MIALYFIALILAINIITNIDAYQLNNRRISSFKRNRTIIIYNNKDKEDYGKDYYMGMITNTDTVESDKKDNLTPNLKLGIIFTGILFGLCGAFVFINKDLPTPSF